MTRNNGEQGQLEAGEESLSLLSIVNMMLRHRWIMLVIPFIAVVATALYVRQQPQQYRAVAMLRAQSSEGRDLGGISSLAQQFLGGGGGGAPELQVHMLTSNEIVREVAAQEFPVPVRGDTLRGTLAELYDMEHPEKPDVTLNRSAGIIARATKASVDRTTGLIELETRARWPDLAIDLNRALIEVVNEYNMERRQFRARDERAFVAERLEEARRELEAAEAALRRFLENNRGGDAPLLMLEEARLNREITLRHNLYTSLAQSYDQARISEVREMPVVEILDRPEVNMYPVPPRLIYNVVLALVLGFLGALGLVFIIEFVARQKHANPEDFAELKVLSREAVKDLKLDRIREVRAGRLQEEELVPPRR